MLNRKYIAVIAVAVCILGLVLFIMAELAVRGAAFIFNKEMAKQEVLQGFVTVETLSADIRGDVTFTGLLWKDKNGNTLIEAPSGSFHARPWDVITGHMKSTTIQKLSLQDATFRIRFNDKMKPDFITEDEETEEKVSAMEEAGAEGVKKDKTDPEAEKLKKDRKQKQSIEDKLENFTLGKRKLRGRLQLNNCTIEAFYKDREYKLEGVNADIDINTAKKLKLDISAGTFGGMMVGNDMSIRGYIDMKERPALCNVDITFSEVDPASLGFGMKIHDKMTLIAKFRGPVTGPTATGTITMKELHIPALDFTDVAGDISYYDGKMDFSNVTASVYNGKLDAYGDYDIDSRAYNIYGKGKKLDSRIALKDMKFKCMVDLDITVKCDGNSRNTLTYGSFKSGKGNYYFLLFDSLEGRFSNQYKKLDFYDVAIHIPGGVISSNAFRIDHGKLKLNKVNLNETGVAKSIRIR